MNIVFKITCIVVLFFISHVTLSGQGERKAEDVEGLQPGDKVSNFIAIDQNDEPFELNDALKKGPVVLVFYRGQWCPICNKHLARIQDSLGMILEKGASLVAVSPELGNLLDMTAEKTGATFSLLHDEGYRIANAFDVSFDPTGKDKTIYNTMLGANLKTAHSDDSERLPIPATYIIGQDGKIIWRHFDPNYKKRASIQDIVDNMPE